MLPYFLTCVLLYWDNISLILGYYISPQNRSLKPHSHSLTATASQPQLRNHNFTATSPHPHLHRHSSTTTAPATASQPQLWIHSFTAPQPQLHIHISTSKAHSHSSIHSSLAASHPRQPGPQLQNPQLLVQSSNSHNSTARSSQPQLRHHSSGSTA